MLAHRSRFFARGLSVLFASGVPLVDALEALSDQNQDEKFSYVVDQLSRRVQEGYPLSQCMAAFSRVFPAVFVSMVRTGEHTGRLHFCLEVLAQWQEREERVKERIKKALTYPAIVISVSLLVCLGLATVIVPQFESTFAELGKDLPLLTVIVVKLTNLLTNPGVWILLAVFGFQLGFVVQQAWKREESRVRMTRFLYSLPALGTLLKLGAHVRFCRAASCLLQAGASMLKALQIAAQASGSALLEKEAQESRRRIQEGSTIAGCFAESEVYLPLLAQMAGVAEESGQLALFFERTADILEQELETRIDTATALLEPIMMAGVGILVGILLLAVFLPLYSMITQL